MQQDRRSPRLERQLVITERTKSEDTIQFFVSNSELPLKWNWLAEHRDRINSGTQIKAKFRSICVQKQR